MLIFCSIYTNNKKVIKISNILFTNKYICAKIKTGDVKLSIYINFKEEQK